MAWADVYIQLPLLQTPSDCGLVSTMARVIIVGCEKKFLDIRGITLIYIVYCLQKQLTIIGRGRAKYRDLSVASRSIICRNRRLRQIIDVWDFGKSRHFVITEFNNCFIIRSPSLHFNEYLREAKRSAFFHARTHHVWFRLHVSRVLFAATHSWTTLGMSRPLFVGNYLQVTWWAFSQWKGRKICIEW